MSLGGAVRSATHARYRDWDPLLLAVSAYILVAVSQIHLLFPFLLRLRPGVVVAAAAIVLLIIDASAERRLSRLNDTATRGVLMLFLWAAVTIPFALYPGLAFQLVTGSLWKVVVLYVVMVGCVRTVRDVERLALVQFAGIVAFSLWVFLGVHLLAGGARIGNIVGSYDPNDLATLAVSGAPLGLFFAGRRHPALIRVFALGGLAAITMVFVRTGSRGGMVAFAAVALYVLFGYRAIPVAWRAFGLALMVVVALAAGNSAYWERMRTILKPSQDYNATSETGRVDIWKRGLGYVMRRPITGVGGNNFPYAEGTISPLARRQELGVGVAWLAPHNSYVQIMAELGIPGLLIFLSILYGAFRALRRGALALVSSSTSALPLAQALTASLIGVLVGVFFLSHGYTTMLYSTIALAAGYGKAGRLTAPPPPAPARRQGRW